MTISRDGEFYQVIYYDYEDLAGEYFAQLEGDEAFSQEEVGLLHENMQGFLDEERNLLNGKRVYPEVKVVDIDFRDRRHPFHCFVINFAGEMQSGLNTYRSELPPEDPLEYTIHSVYQFPQRTKIQEVITKMHYQVVGNLILFWASKGQSLGMLEEITFQL